MIKYLNVSGNLTRILYHNIFFFKIQWVLIKITDSINNVIFNNSEVGNSISTTLLVEKISQERALIILSIRNIDKEFISTACLHPDSMYAFLRTNTIIESQTCSDTRNLSTINLRTEFLLNFHRITSISFLFPFLFQAFNDKFEANYIFYRWKFFVREKRIYREFLHLNLEISSLRYFGILRRWDSKVINKF